MFRWLYTPKLNALMISIESILFSWSPCWPSAVEKEKGTLNCHPFSSQFIQWVPCNGHAKASFHSESRYSILIKINEVQMPTCGTKLRVTLAAPMHVERIAFSNTTWRFGRPAHRTMAQKWYHFTDLLAVELCCANNRWSAPFVKNFRRNWIYMYTPRDMHKTLWANAIVGYDSAKITSSRSMGKTAECVNFSIFAGTRTHGNFHQVILGLLHARAHLSIQSSYRATSITKIFCI
jgi:hypothetical protein